MKIFRLNSDVWGHRLFVPMRRALFLHEGRVLGDLNDFSDADVSELFSILGIITVFL